MTTPQELAEFALEVNNATRGESDKISFSEGRQLTAGAKEAFRQAIIEIYILPGMTAEDWFNDQTVRRVWSDQIRMIYDEWIRTKANGS